MLAHARSKLSSVQRRFRIDFNRIVSFRPVVNAEDFEYFDRPPRAVTEAERRDPRRLPKDTTEASRKLVPQSEGLYCVRSVTETVVHIVSDGETTSVSINHVTRVPTGPRALQSSPATGGKAKSEAAITEAAAGTGATVQNPTETGSVREEEETMSLKTSSAIAARERACSTVLGGTSTILEETKTSPPSCCRNTPLTGTGKWFTERNRIPTH